MDLAKDYIKEKTRNTHITSNSIKSEKHIPWLTHKGGIFPLRVADIFVVFYGN